MKSDLTEDQWLTSEEHYMRAALRLAEMEAWRQLGQMEASWKLIEEVRELTGIVPVERVSCPTCGTLVDKDKLEARG